MTVKDHKAMIEGKLPDTRYMVSGVQGMGLSMNNMAADIVESLGDSMTEDSVELKSSEHLMNALDRYNKWLEDRILNAVDMEEVEMLMEERLLLGTDVKSLFPSMTKETTAQTIKDAFLNSELEVHTEWKEMARYIALNCSQSEIKSEGLSVWIPSRTGTRGARPGIVGNEERAGKAPEVGGQWTFNTDLDPPREVVRKMIAMTLQLAVKACWELQVHQFGGKKYLQNKGGPIGMRITMACSRVVMIMWGREAVKRLRDSGMSVWLAKIYVDDGRFLISMLGPGMRFCDETRTICKDPEVNVDTDTESAEIRTRREVMIMFNAISKDLKFTSEVENEFVSNRLPTLDLEIWKDDIGRLRYSYFEKSMSNKYCIMKRTALPGELQKSVLVAEATRRLFNMDQYIGEEEKTDKLDKFDQKMKISGYRKKERRRILSDAVVGYNRKVRRCKEDRKPLHRDAKKDYGQK